MTANRLSRRDKSIRKRQRSRKVGNRHGYYQPMLIEYLLSVCLALF